MIHYVLDRGLGLLILVNCHTFRTYIKFCLDVKFGFIASEREKQSNKLKPWQTGHSMNLLPA